VLLGIGRLVREDKGLFYVGGSVNILDYIWCGLHFPVQLPGRQAFMYVAITPSGFWLGLMVSIMGVGSLIGYELLRKKKRNAVVQGDV